MYSLLDFNLKNAIYFKFSNKKAEWPLFAATNYFTTFSQAEALQSADQVSK